VVESKLKIFGVCSVAEDKLPEEDLIEAYPLEHMTHYEGDISSEEEIKEDVVGKEGDVSKVSIKRRMTVNARWFAPGGSNRVTSPDVKKGETVLVYKFGDTDEYFWTTIFNEMDLRRKETVKYVYGNVEEFGAEQTDETTYWWKVDTVGKSVSWHTSDNDGELCTYDYNLNTLDGILSFLDGGGNGYVWTSDPGDLELTLLNTLTVNSKMMVLNAEDSYALTSKDYKATIDGPVHFDLKTLAFKNDTGELVSILVDLLDAMLKEKHIGNLGAPTALDPGSIAAYNEIKEKISSFME